MPRSLALLLTLATGVSAQTPSAYATKVIRYEPGPRASNGFTQPSRALGAPRGRGGTMQSVDVVSLGDGGRLTLGFDQPITNGPGADFLVFENAFFEAISLRSFAEVVFVEVSSNGRDFARFPASYVGPASAIGPFGTLPPGTWGGLAGTTPIFANPDLFPDIDPRDPAHAGGDAFDLEDLRDDPLVKNGRVNLFRIAQVRLVDVVDDLHRDARGRKIRDPAPGNADIDAVSVLHFLLTRSEKDPAVRLWLTPQRTLRLAIADSDGLTDLDPRRLNMSVQGVPLDFSVFLGLCRVIRSDARSFELETRFQVATNTPIKLAASATDRGRRIAGASVVLH